MTDQATRIARTNAVGWLQWGIVIVALVAGFVAYSFAHDPDRHPPAPLTRSDIGMIQATDQSWCEAGDGVWIESLGRCAYPP